MSEFSRSRTFAASTGAGCGKPSHPAGLRDDGDPAAGESNRPQEATRRPNAITNVRRMMRMSNHSDQWLM